MKFPDLSFRTQFFLIGVFCLGLLGVGSVFLNAYVIAGLKEDMKQHAFLLAEEQARRVSEEIQKKVEAQGAKGLLAAKNDPLLAQQVEVLLQGNKNVMAVCILDSEGNVVMANTGVTPEMVELRKDKQGGVQANFDPANFNSIKVRLRPTHPRLEEVKVPIGHKHQTLGNLRFLISTSGIYRDIEASSREISRRIWSAMLGFVGVVALGLFLMARLFRRQVHLMEKNEQLDRMAYVGTLASGMAHEIRNPLNAMSVNLTVAEEELAAPECEPEILRRVVALLRRETTRLNQSVSSFMEFAMPQRFGKERTELRPVVEEVVELLRPRIEECGTEVSVVMPEDATVDADFSGLRQVLYNVMLNAVQAMAERKGAPNRLEVGARRESAQWLLWLEDTGPGIPAGQEEKIFEVFHSTKAAGSGFGLSIAKAIIQRHGGEILARRGERGGARFEITLPETGKGWK